MYACTVDESFVNARCYRCMRRWDVFACDQCGVMFAKGRGLKDCTGRVNVFCTRQCFAESIRNGAVGTKMRLTCLARHGAENPLQSPEINVRVRRTAHERYGSACAATSPTRVHVTRATKLARYGDESWSNREQSRVTTLKNHGVPHVVGLVDSVKAAANSPEACRRRHETMKRNGTYARSRPEDSLHTALVEAFGQEHVERFVNLNGWELDFHVKTHDVHVQLDGAYWHGLNDARTSSGPRACSIARTVQRDRARVAWFEAHGHRLVRASDTYVSRNGHSPVIEAIKNCGA